MFELLPCPFCGHPADLIHDTNCENEANYLWYVSCLNICCSANGAMRSTAEDAVEKWNTRQSEQAIRDSYLLPGHKCEKIASMIMDENRNWWLGKLTEPISGWPNETHCLHIKTPLKEIVLGVNYGDMSQLAVLCQIVCGPINQHWLDNMANVLTKKVNND